MFLTVVWKKKQAIQLCQLGLYNAIFCINLSFLPWWWWCKIIIVKMFKRLIWLNVIKRVKALMTMKQNDLKTLCWIKYYDFSTTLKWECGKEFWQSFIIWMQISYQAWIQNKQLIFTHAGITSALLDWWSCSLPSWYLAVVHVGCHNDPRLSFISLSEHRSKWWGIAFSTVLNSLQQGKQMWI